MEIILTCQVTVEMQPQRSTSQTRGRRGVTDRLLLLQAMITLKHQTPFIVELQVRPPVRYRCGLRQPIKIGEHWLIGVMK